MPGAWTCLEEWRGIDLLAWSSWQSQGGYARVGYEVKVSRADYRRELARPGKRAGNVEWCNEFYFAVPKGLLRREELLWQPPPGFDAEPPFEPMRCPGAYGSYCLDGQLRMGRGKLRTRFDTPWGRGRLLGHNGPCPTCRGLGSLAPPPVVRAGAPPLWIPADVGLVLVDGRRATVWRKAPRRRDVPPIGPREAGQLVRWVSMRPDPRHHPQPAAAAA